MILLSTAIPAQIYPIFGIKLIAIFIGFTFWRKFDISYRLIFIHLLIALVVEALGLYLNYIKQPNNFWLFNIYMIIEVWLIGLAGKYFLQDKLSDRYILISLIGFSVYWIISFKYKPITSLLNVFFILTFFFLVAVYIAVLVKKTFINNNVFNDPLFYLCVSCILYFACLIPLLGLINYLFSNNMKAAFNLFYISHILNFLRYSLVAVAFYLYGSQVKRGYVRQ